jgi:hypothetical protein
MKEVHDHSFNVNAATAIGHEKAILLKELYYWCQQNFNNQRNFHHGLYWTYNTAKAFTLKFPYFSERSIGRWLQQLEQDGYLGSACLNKKGYDRTKWYCVNEEAYVSICEGSKPGSLEFFKKYITNLANSNRQNGEWNSQNGESFSQNGEPIPPLNPSPNPSIKPTTFVENSFSTVTLIDEVDETSVEIHHVPEYFDTEQKPKRKKVAPKKEKVTDDPTPITPMWQEYEKRFADINQGETPVFHKKYLRSLKTLFAVLRERTIKKGIVPLNDIQPWCDFLDMAAQHLKNNPKETYLRGRFDPIGIEAEFNKWITTLNNRPKTDAEKWMDFARRNGVL